MQKDIIYSETAENKVFILFSCGAWIFPLMISASIK